MPELVPCLQGKLAEINSLGAIFRGTVEKATIMGGGICAYLEVRFTELSRYIGHGEWTPEDILIYDVPLMAAGMIVWPGYAAIDQFGTWECIFFGPGIDTVAAREQLIRHSQAA